MFARVKSTYQEFPVKFWVLVGSAFVDATGRTMIFPFFALYITQKFDVGMTEAGILLALFSIFGFIGSLFGGALTDKLGRRGMVIFGLVFSALSSVAMGLVDVLAVFYGLAVVVGLFSNVAGPARQAMLADLLPEEQRAEGFGILRVGANLAWIVGPTIGGLLAAHSYLLLFILDSITSVITAVIVYKFIPETKPASSAEQAGESFLTTLSGYRQVARDKIFVSYLLVSILMLLAYLQVYNTLSVYLRDIHDIPARGYGLLMSINAGAVVALQFWVTRRFKAAEPLKVMAFGSLFYVVGLVMYGTVSGFGLFVLAMLIVTVGEMITLPVSQSLAARFAPEAMRGRYLAVFGLGWTIPAAIGPWVAGLIMDNYDPNWVWYLSGGSAALAAAGFYLLYFVTGRRSRGAAPVRARPVLVEAGD